MKLTAPWENARMIRRAPSGISRSALVAPSNGGTSDQSVLTVPAFLSPPSHSASLQEIPTPRTRARARREPVTLILASNYLVTIALTLIDFFIFFFLFFFYF